MECSNEKHKERFVKACHKVAEYGLLKCSSGNMSWRCEDDVMLVTGSRTWMGEITADQVAVVSIMEGNALGNVKPSIESIFHAGILRHRKDANVVLHFQSPNATAMCCRDISKINFNVLPEMPFYLGDPIEVPYLQPGSDELADAVIHAAGEHDMILLKNHGLVTLGEDFNQTIQKAVFFELVCGILIQNGDQTKHIPGKEVRKLKEAASLKKGGA